MSFAIAAILAYYVLRRFGSDEADTAVIILLVGVMATMIEGLFLWAPIALK